MSQRVRTVIGAVLVGVWICAPNGRVPAAQTRAECFIFARATDPPTLSDETECRHPAAPASTFKIPHALLALETGVITPETVVRWDGSRRNFPRWQRDHNLDSAMKASVLPFFQHTATLIGIDRMRRGLRTLQYAADTFDGNLAMFWINGDLVVSPGEQMAFLRRMFAGTLPIAPRHVAVVKDAIRMPPGRILNASGEHPFPLTWPAATVIYAKTGSTSAGGEAVRWVVGALEDRGIDHIFVARVRSRGELPATAAVDVAARELNRRGRGNGESGSSHANGRRHPISSGASRAD